MYCSKYKLHAYCVVNKLVIKEGEQWTQRRCTAGSAFQHAARQNSLCLSAEVEGVNVYQGEQSRHKGERNTMCACASMCICAVCVLVCALKDGSESVVFHSFLPWCTALLFCTRGTSHAEWVLFDIDSSLRERVHSKTGAGEFILGKKQIVVYFPGSGCRTCEEPTALMLQRWHSTR